MDQTMPASANADILEMGQRFAKVNIKKYRPPIRSRVYRMKQDSLVVCAAVMEALSVCCL